AGILHYIRTMLPEKQKRRQFDIHCGASVGAINACFLAATSHDYRYQGNAVRDLWEKVREEDIYQRNLKALFNFIRHSSKGMITKYIQSGPKNSPHFPGFLDTKPFIPFIEKSIPWKMIPKNIQKGHTRALSVVTTNVFTGRVELFLETHPSIHYSGAAIHHDGTVLPIHAAASAAIPIIFPTVMIDGVAYTDGGLRLNTPLSPAIHLGADAALVIGLNHRAGPDEKIPFHGTLGEPPSLGQVLGRVLNAVFLDKIQNDLEQVERINHIIDWCEDLYGRRFLVQLNEMLYEKGIIKNIADRGLKRLKILRIRPSVDIAELFREAFQKGRDKHFTTFERFLIRMLDVDPTNGVDFLSYIAFMPEYLNALLDLGFHDAKTHHHQLKEFMEN
ncbi:MAG: patatin-like phospholipase family protein, partial [Deltaproteobacteria bacterium]|nr:patatin-like phospholipase family protein [Deltaproteobacteria bacterium]